MRNKIKLIKIDDEYAIRKGDKNYFSFELYWTFDLQIGNKSYSQVYIK